jgi:hypothetical protein
MTRFAALVLVPNTLPTEQVTEAAYERLLPFMLDDDKPEEDGKFDYLIELEDYDEEEVGQFIWPTPDLPPIFADLGIDAIVTPNGIWHENPEPLWDDPLWVAEARQLFEEHSETIAVKYILHI